MLFYRKKKINAKNIHFQLHALHKNDIRKKNNLGQIANCIREALCVHGILFSQPCTMLYCFLLYAPAKLSVALFQHLMCLVRYYQDEFPNRFCKKLVGPYCKLHWCSSISCAMGTIMDEFATGSLKNWQASIICNTCLLVFVSAMDCNPRARLIYVCMPFACLYRNRLQ